MLQALQSAHAGGVVHRDIKPENILLTSGTAIVADFGIAKALGDARTTTGGPGTLTQVGTAVGTPAYMAPEQAAGDPGTAHRADLYAWGVMAYEVLGGRHPFAHHATAHALLAAQLAEPPAPLDATRANLPVAVTGAVMRCLAKAPEARPADAPWSGGGRWR